MAEHLASIFGTEKDRVNCPFYFKIGACRHGDRCSRLHNKPTISPTLLLSNMYQRPDLVMPGVTPQGQNIDPRKVQQHFEDFYEDIFEELSKYGEIESLNVCDNLADHMVGNVYIQYQEAEHAGAALRAMTGRFYAGRPILVEFSPVTDFREATCRQYEENTCNRGGYCNFMHLRKVSRMSEIKDLVHQRWEWMRRPIHGMAAFLHPLWAKPDSEVFVDPVVMGAREAYLSRVYSEEMHMKIDEDICLYQNGCGPAFTRPFAHKRDICLKPIKWWQTYGYSTINLQTCALRVLSQDCSAGACERNWSAYSLIHTKIRNRLSTAQLERLVFCRANLRLFRNFSSLAGPKQVDPDSIDLLASSNIPREHDNEEEIYAQLHRELETVDRRVTRATRRALAQRKVAGALSSMNQRNQSRGRGCRVRRGRVSTTRTYTRRGSASHTRVSGNSSEEEEMAEEEEPEGNSEENEMEYPEYDTSGNSLSEGDYCPGPSNTDSDENDDVASSSSSSDHDES